MFKTDKSGKVSNLILAFLTYKHQRVATGESIT